MYRQQATTSTKYVKSEKGEYTALEESSIARTAGRYNEKEEERLTIRQWSFR